MRNFKMMLEYDGTDFHGWQRQQVLRTVQGTLEDALGAIVKRDVQVNGAGRTDAGVHAIGQVSNAVLDTEMTPDQVDNALASRVPEDIQIYRVEEVDLRFHARFSATSRRYSYYLRTEPTAIWRRFAHVVTFPLDLKELQRAAQYLVGEMDFVSFTPTRSALVPTVCKVLRLDIEPHDEIIVVHVQADHFLHNMVRVIVGTLIEVGRGKYPAEHVEEILCRKERGAAGPTVPPNGLFLTEVCYNG